MKKYEKFVFSDVSLAFLYTFPTSVNEDEPGSLKV